MSEETNNFRPTNDTPAKQHLVDAALDELRQRGTGDATGFLDSINEQLDRAEEQQSKITPIATNPKPKLLVGIGLAAALAAGLFIIQFYLAAQKQNQNVSAIQETKKKTSEVLPTTTISKNKNRNFMSDEIESFEPKQSPHTDLFSHSNGSPLPAPTPVTSAQEATRSPQPTIAATPSPAQKLHTQPSDALRTRDAGIRSRSKTNAFRQNRMDSLTLPHELKPELQRKTKRGNDASLFNAENGVTGGFVKKSNIFERRSAPHPSSADNLYLSPLKHPLSTFSVDVNTGAYSNIRHMINSGQKPPNDAVRIEELINFFSYNYPKPKGENPFAFAVEMANSPWNSDHQLLRVGIQGKEVLRNKRPAANLVFLLDVSQSMSSPDKLPLVKQSIKLLLEELNENDTLSIVTYSGTEGLYLPPTKGNQNSAILQSLDNLSAGDSTTGGTGIKLAYRAAKENFKQNGINRVILCTDENFNISPTDRNSLVWAVENNAKKGTHLTVLAFGSSNISDNTLEAITNKGNHNYFYIDSIQETQKALLQELKSMPVTIAKNVKIQIEFNSKHVKNYRLIGFAPPTLKAHDKIEAAEIPAGHVVTALYEIIPNRMPPVVSDPTQNLNHQKRATEPAKESKIKIADSDKLCTVKLRYKDPAGDTKQTIEKVVTYQPKEWHKASNDYQFAAALALWGMQLQDPKQFKTNQTELILALAKKGVTADPSGRRKAFIELVKKSQNQ